MIKIKKLTENKISKFRIFIKGIKKDHIFVKNKKIIQFFYNYKKLKNFNMLLLYYKNEITAAMGVVTYSNWSFSNNLKDKFIAFLLKKPGSQSTIPLFGYLNKLNPKLLAAININKHTTGKIYNHFSEVKKFSHYYIKNPELKCNLSKKLVNPKKINNPKFKYEISSNLRKMPLQKFHPKKNKKYFINKYINNPFYKYQLFKIFKNNKLKLIFVFRIIKIKKISFVRIVDAFGDLKLKNNISSLFIDFIVKNHHEFIDLYIYSNKVLNIEKLGFNKKKNEFIPYYSEPYNNKVTDLHICILKSDKNENVFFKGDGDAERPYRI